MSLCLKASFSQSSHEKAEESERGEREEGGGECIEYKVVAVQ
jgi:hypothetical protein